MIQLDTRAVVYRAYKAAIKSIKSKGGDARRPIERYHQPVSYTHLTLPTILRV